MYVTAPNGAYIDFTAVGSSTKGRMMYTRSTDQYDWYIASSAPSKMTLKAAGLYVGATLVSASDKRLKFNEKPLVNALDIIARLEPVEYDQTFNLVENYTPETPQSHQCGFIAQSVEKMSLSTLWKEAK